jgi:hypothetical protein
MTPPPATCARGELEGKPKRPAKATRVGRKKRLDGCAISLFRLVLAVSLPAETAEFLA